MSARRVLRVLVGATLFAAPAVPAAAPTTKPAPAFTIKLFDGSKTTLADYRGKVLVINYWATWCAPCKAEMPMMSAYHRKNRHRGFEIVGVVTKDSVSKPQLARVVAALSYPLASNLSGKYGLIDEAVPTSYIIDRAGHIRHSRAGRFTASEFNDLISPLLDEPAP